jgi:hypothetical protein
VTTRRWLVLVASISMLGPSCALDVNPSQSRPMCLEDNRAVILLAQSVPDATWVPCMRRLPAGWTWGAQAIERGSGRFQLAVGVEGTIDVALLPSCETSGMGSVTVPNTDATIAAYRDLSTDAGITGDYRFTFTGGCITWSLALAAGTPVAALEEIEATIGFLFRPLLASRLERDAGVRLCGAGAPPCEGEG